MASGVDAHRFSYELAYGAIPAKHDVHHTCHRRSCVRPEHLLATTQLARTFGLRDEPAYARLDP